MRTREPHELMAKLNRRHQDDSETDQYFTMVYAIINRNTGKVRMCQAGHPNPLVLWQDGSSIFVGDGRAPVGLFSFTEYDSIEFELQQNERLFLFSDGITECERPDGSLWDEEGLAQMFSDRQHTNLEQFPSQLIDKLSSVHGTCDFTDDVSGVLINPWGTPNEGCNDTIRKVA